MYVTLSPAKRQIVEGVVLWILILSSTIAVLTTIGIVLSVLLERLHFFRSVPVTDFLFGLDWSPQTSFRPGQVGFPDGFGVVPLLAGTLLTGDQEFDSPKTLAAFALGLLLFVGHFRVASLDRRQRLQANTSVVAAGFRRGRHVR